MLLYNGKKVILIFNYRNKKSKKSKLLMVMICLLMIATGIVVGILVSNFAKHKIDQNNHTREYDSELSDIVEDEISEPETMVESIALPCFETLIMAADTMEQTVNFYNPVKNTGIDFQLTLFLVSNDESQEDILLWQSGLIPCGKAIYSISLNHPLTSGIYKARLQYNCYSLSGKQLNGSNLNFNLLVE